jgi:hypothetical protein
MSLTYLQMAAAHFGPPVRHEAQALMVAAGVTAHPDRTMLLSTLLST